jgi:hypothetical protein
MRNKWNNAWNKANLLTSDNKFAQLHHHLHHHLHRKLSSKKMMGKTGYKKRATKKPRLLGARKTLAG